MRNRDTNTATVRVANGTQKVLLDQELFGQFSDGYWENSRNRSWEVLGEAEVANEANPVGVTFSEYRTYDYKGYSVNNKELLSYVGDRMLVYSRFANYFKLSEISDNEASFLEYAAERTIFDTTTKENLESVLTDWNRPEDKFWFNRRTSALGLIETYGMDEILNALNDTSYGMKEMRKDLTQITKALKTF